MKFIRPPPKPSTAAMRRITIDIIRYQTKEDLDLRIIRCFCRKKPMGEKLPCRETVTSPCASQLCRQIGGCWGFFPPGLHSAAQKERMAPEGRQVEFARQVPAQFPVSPVQPS